MAKPSFEPLGPRVRQARLDAGLTQAQLAERADIADATISRIERNRLTPSLALSRKIAQALGVTVDALLSKALPVRAKGVVRPAEARLLAIVRDLDDAIVDDITRGLRLLLAAGRGSSRKEA